VNQLRQVGRLSRWLEAGGLSAADLSGERVEEFLSWQRADGRYRSGMSRPGLVCLLEVLRGLGVLAPPGRHPRRFASAPRSRQVSVAATCCPVARCCLLNWRLTRRSWSREDVANRTEGIGLWIVRRL
jgi:hypothetical protein